MFLRLNQEKVEEGKGEWRALLTWPSSLGCIPHILLGGCSGYKPQSTSTSAPFPFCLFFSPQSAFRERGSRGACPGQCLSGLELPKPCANSPHGGVIGGRICSPNLQEIAAGWQETSSICTSLAPGFYSGGSSLCPLGMSWRHLSAVKVFSLLLCPVSHGSCCHCYFGSPSAPHRAAIPRILMEFWDGPCQCGHHH